MEPETGPEQRATRAEQDAPRGELRGDRLRRHAHRTGLYTSAGALVVLPVVVIALVVAQHTQRQGELGIGSTYQSLVWIILATAILGWLLGIVTNVIFRFRTRRRHLSPLTLIARSYRDAMAGAPGSCERISEPAMERRFPPPRRSRARRTLGLSRRGSPAPSREQWSMALRLKRGLLLGVMLALLGAGCGGGGKLGAKALAQQSKSLQSEAAEGALLAQDAVSGKTTRVYTREHSADLYKAASQAEASLKAAKTEPALEPKLRQLAVLAAQIRADLKRLGGASKDEARALGRELQTAAEESQKIGEGLK